MHNLIILLILFGIVLLISIIVVLLVFVFFKNNDNDNDKSADEYCHTNKINDVNTVDDITEVPVISKKRSRKKKPWYESKKFRTNKF